MEAYEATRLVYSRVQAMEPDLVPKIMGYVLLQDQGEQEMYKLAYGPDTQIQSIIAKAKQQLGLAAPSAPSSAAMVAGQPAAPPVSVATNLFSSITSAPTPSPLLLPPDPYPFYEDPMSHHHFFTAPDAASAAYAGSPHPDTGYNAAFYAPRGALSSTALRRPSSLSEFPLSPDSSCLSPAWKPCLYYSRGYCKHGSNCRFLHHNSARSDPASPNSAYSVSSANGGGGLSLRGDSRSDDGFPQGSLERLEVELEELLRGRRAPVSIASLPQLYYEKFGRTLQAEGYLTESQRHGKAGFSLTKLLARLKNTVTLIDRPHGQHAVVLAEDAFRYHGNRGERDDLNAVNPGSRQIYLTFPADSTFSEEDVSGYFRGYGPVQDVRIPFQQKRMFGFVTFVYPETVKAILAKGNPHYICGARVLVKPYKEKSKHNERRLVERDHSRFLPSRSFDSREFPLSPGIQFLDDHDLLRRQMNHEQALEVERLRFAEMQFNDSPQHLFMQTGAPPSSAIAEPTQPQFGYISNGLSNSASEAAKAAAADDLNVSSAFGYILDVLEGDPSENEQGKEKLSESETSNEHNLPDSLFASPKADQSQTRASSALESSISFSAGMPSLFLPETRLTSNYASFDDDKELTCRICKGFFVDPIRLDCNHMFCVNCILKVIRVSKDECPLCQRHIGSQIVRLLETRGLPVIDPSLTKSRVPAISSQKITSW